MDIDTLLRELGDVDTGPLADAILSSRLNPGQTAVVNFGNEGFTLDVK
jgi:hypothetical protein